VNRDCYSVIVCRYDDENTFFSGGANLAGVRTDDTYNNIGAPNVRGGGSTAVAKWDTPFWIAVEANGVQDCIPNRCVGLKTDIDYVGTVLNACGSIREGDNGDLYSYTNAVPYIPGRDDPSGTYEGRLDTIEGVWDKNEQVVAGIPWQYSDFTNLLRVTEDGPVSHDMKFEAHWVPGGKQACLFRDHPGWYFSNTWHSSDSQAATTMEANLRRAPANIFVLSGLTEEVSFRVRSTLAMEHLANTQNLGYILNLAAFPKPFKVPWDALAALDHSGPSGSGTLSAMAMMPNNFVTGMQIAAGVRPPAPTRKPTPKIGASSPLDDHHVLKDAENIVGTGAAMAAAPKVWGVVKRLAATAGRRAVGAGERYAGRFATAALERLPMAMML